MRRTLRAALLVVALALTACQRPPPPPPLPSPPAVRPAAPKVVIPPGFPPAGAVQWKRTILTEWRYAFGINADASVAFAQIHQESGYKEDAKSRLGALGLAQFMPTTAVGFQTNVSRLQELCGKPEGCPLEPRWAIRALTAYDHGEWTWAGFAPTERDRWAYALASYNGGRGNLQKERLRCAAMADCNSHVWFGQVDRVCLRAQWACDENRDYPLRILGMRRPLYQQWLSR